MINNLTSRDKIMYTLMFFTLWWEGLNKKGGMNLEWRGIDKRKNL
jgi:hypothetical protein